MALVTHRHREVATVCPGSWRGGRELRAGTPSGLCPIHRLFPVKSHKCIPLSAAFQQGLRAPFSVAAFIKKGLAAAVCHGLCREQEELSTSRTSGSHRLTCATRLPLPSPFSFSKIIKHRPIQRIRQGEQAPQIMSFGHSGLAAFGRGGTRHRCRSQPNLLSLAAGPHSPPRALHWDAIAERSIKVATSCHRAPLPVENIICWRLLYTI